METMQGSQPAPAQKKSNKALIISIVVLVIAAVLAAGWFFFARSVPEPIVFPLSENGEQSWYALTQETITAAETPASFKKVPSTLLHEDEFGAVFAEDGTAVTLSSIGLVTIDTAGVRTTLLEREGLEPASSALASDATGVVLYNPATNALDVFALDQVRPSVLSYEGSLAVTDALYGVALLSRSQLLVRTSLDAFVLYSVSDGAVTPSGKASLAGAAQAFLATPVAHAYTYGNPLTSSGAVTTASKRCTGALVASLGTATGEGVMPSAQTTVWNYMGSSSNLPASYNQAGTYCIQAHPQTFSGGAYAPTDSFALLGIPKAFAIDTDSSWQIDFELHSGTGITTAGGYYSLTYTAVTTVTLNASPNPVDQGGSVALTWNAVNATSCTPTGFVTGGALSGTVSVSPSTTTTYSITCSGNGSASASRTVTVVLRPNLTVTAPVITVGTGGPGGVATTFTATVQNAGAAAAGASTAMFQYTQDTSNPAVNSAAIDDVSALAVGASEGISGSTSNFDQGTYYMRACADYANGVAESNEGDNCSAWVQVNVPAGPNSALAVSCSPSTTSAAAGETVVWTATAVGGGGGYTYSWGGTDALTGSTASVNKAYALPGTKTASVTVTTGNQTSGTTTQWVDSGYQYGKCFNSCPHDEFFNPDPELGGDPTCSPVGATCTYCDGWGDGVYWSKSYYQCQVVPIPSGPSVTVDCTAPVTVTPATECNDGLDNDSDGAADSPADPGCVDPTDTTEDPNPATGVSSCTVDTPSPAAGTPVTYTAIGGSAPYAWTPSNPSMCASGTGSTRSCTYTTPGPYTMQVAASIGSPVTCTGVTVGSAPAAYITASPDRVNGAAPGGSTSLLWSASGVSACVITGSNGSTPLSATAPAVGTTTTSATGITKQVTYTINCDSGAVTDSVIVNVIPRFEEF